MVSNDPGLTSIEGCMLFDWLRDALSWHREPLLPALLRVREPDGTPAGQVRLSGVFDPGGERVDRTVTTAGGLCMLEWPAQARSLRVQVGAGDTSTELEIQSRRPDPDHVIEVQLG